jgi:hypothetical protein
MQLKPQYQTDATSAGSMRDTRGDEHQKVNTKHLQFLRTTLLRFHC